MPTHLPVLYSGSTKLTTCPTGISTLGAAPKSDS
jgi:hypothetical protein